MDLLKLEQQRLALEESLHKLRQSLKHWQLWEAEYEGLKEEIIGITSENATSLQLENVAKTYEGDLVNEKEIRELSGLDKNAPRTAKQIIGLIERRQEYVQKNIETVQRQFFEAEAKSEELAFAAASRPDYETDLGAGLPLTEIHEELDDEDNIISSHLSQPEEATSKIDEYARGMISGSGSTLFEELGLYYIGPIDGHNLDNLLAVLKGEQGSWPKFAPECDLCLFNIIWFSV